MADDTHDQQAGQPNPQDSQQQLELSSDQKQRIELKRLKALELRKSRVQSHNPYLKEDHHSTVNRSSSCCTMIMEDSRGGFMLPPIDNEAVGKQKIAATSHPVAHQNVVALGDEAMICDDCGGRFAESFLFSNFNVTVCDTCRDPDDKHSLITKTEAKERFLLKECDFNDRGGPQLKYLSRRNPRGYHGDMKLFLLSQIKERSYALWNGEKGLETERQRRSQVREKKKVKSYSKQLEELRSTVYSRSSSTAGGRSSSSSQHTHEYSSEQYNSSTDTWTKTCDQCGQTVTFEKM